MKIIKNFLDPRLIDQVLKNNEVFAENGFKDSNGFWPEELKRPGSNIKTRFLSNPKSYILRELMKEHGLMNKDFNGQFIAMAYIWQPLSYIPWHHDRGHEVAVTIYLNKNWNMDWGGLLLYQDKESGRIDVLPPTYNVAAVNDSKVEHATTILTPDAPPRLTIQCFWKTVVAP